MEPEFDIQKEQGLRLEEFYKSLGFDGKSFAMAIGVTQSLVSQCVNGHKPITHTLIGKITQRYPELNIDWLMRGYGNRTRPLNRQIDFGQEENPNTPIQDDGSIDGLLNWAKRIEARIQHLEVEVAALRRELELDRK
jgi:transcriptional regulator with XRE-family HTH domain